MRVILSWSKLSLGNCTCSCHLGEASALIRFFSSDHKNKCSWPNSTCFNYSYMEETEASSLLRAVQYQPALKGSSDGTSIVERCYVWIAMTTKMLQTVILLSFTLARSQLGPSFRYAFRCSSEASMPRTWNAHTDAPVCRANSDAHERRRLRHVTLMLVFCRRLHSKERRYHRKVSSSVMIEITIETKEGEKMKRNVLDNSFFSSTACVSSWKEKWGKQLQLTKWFTANILHLFFSRAISDEGKHNKPARRNKLFIWPLNQLEGSQTHDKLQPVKTDFF